MKVLPIIERIAVVVLAVMVALLITLAANGQTRCPDGRCPLQPRMIQPGAWAPQHVPQLVRHEWRTYPGDPDRDYLYRNDTLLGAWCYRECHWRDYDAASGKWGEPKEQAPFQVPGRVVPPNSAKGPEPCGREFAAPGMCLFKARRLATLVEDAAQAVGELAFVENAVFCQADDCPNYGINLDKMKESKVGPRYERNGRPITREAAFQALVEQLPDDADALRLTYCGPDADRVRRDWESALPLGEWKGKVSLQCYESPDVPMLKGKGFAGGVQIQSPDGRRLGAAPDYPGAEELAEGLRNADARRRDPNWKPSSWPPLKDTPRPLDGLRDMSAATAWVKRNWLVLTLAAGGGYLLYTRRRKDGAT